MIFRGRPRGAKNPKQSALGVGTERQQYQQVRRRYPRALILGPAKEGLWEGARLSQAYILQFKTLATPEVCGGSIIIENRCLGRSGTGSQLPAAKFPPRALEDREPLDEFLRRVGACGLECGPLRNCSHREITPSLCFLFLIVVTR